MIYVLFCLVSPYIYTWFAIYGTPDQNSIKYSLMLMFESYFFFSIIFTFFVEIEMDGQIQPVRDM